MSRCRYENSLNSQKAGTASASIPGNAPRSTAHRVESDCQVQDADPGTHAPDTRRIPTTNRRGAVSISDRLAQPFRLMPEVKVEGCRWAIEDSFETAKNELGLDHNKPRSWHGWHRHVSQVMLAFAMMAVIRYHANAAPPQKRSATG